MFAIEVQGVFCAAHQLRLADGTLESVHGHNWQVTVRVEAGELDEIDTVMDFHPLEAALGAICRGWNNSHLNEIEPFKSTINPSAERVAEQIGRLLMPTVVQATRGRARVAEVRVTEAPNCVALWRAD